MLKKTLWSRWQIIADNLPTALLRSLTKQRFVLPFYHVISDKPLAHIKHLYAVKTPKEFIADLDFLCQYYTPVSLEEVVDFVYQNKKLPRNAFFLSFDDGLAECATVIAPILKQKGIAATFFLNSNFVDNKALMFRYKASLLIDFCSNNSIDSQVLQPFFNSYQLPFTGIDSFLSVRWQQQSLLDELALHIGLDFQQFLKEKTPYLTSRQIKKMQEEGFNFGSHSCTHPTYFKIPLSQQIQETIDSQLFINKKYQPKQQVFAFPFTDFGVSTAFFDKILEQQKFDLTFGGAGIKGELIKGQLQRIALEGQQNLSAKKILNTAYCYYIIKAFFRKNTIRR